MTLLVTCSEKLFASRKPRITNLGLYRQFPCHSPIRCVNDQAKAARAAALATLQHRRQTAARSAVPNSPLGADSSRAPCRCDADAFMRPIL
eukprot:908495-Pleurochrysis_carterae.AAC.5